METIKKNREFRYIYSTKKSIADSLLVIYKSKATTPNNRFGITVSSKVGNAVVRNKIRRRLKEILRLYGDEIKVGFDIIILARVRAKNANYDELRTSVYYLCKKQNLLINPARRWN